MNPPLKMAQCRVCIGRGKGRKLIPLTQFDADRSINWLAEAISAVGGVRVEIDDGLPQYCCLRCLREVETAHKLKRKCQESDRKLREMFREELARLAQVKRALPPEEDVVEVKQEKEDSFGTEEVLLDEEIETSRLQERDATDATNCSDGQTIPGIEADLVQVKQEMPLEDVVEVKKEKEDVFETEELIFKEEIEESRLQEHIQAASIKQEAEEQQLLDNVLENLDELSDEEAPITEDIEEPRLQQSNDAVEVSVYVSDDEEEAPETHLQYEEQESINDDDEEEYFEVMAIVESSEEEEEEEDTGKEDHAEQPIRVLKCSSCEQTYKTVKELEEHVQIAGDYSSVKELETRVQCKVFTSTVLASLKKSKKINHENNPILKRRRYSEDDDTDRSRICCGCSQYCETPEEFEAHILELHYVQRTEPDEKRPYTCDVCYKSFTNGYDRLVHDRRCRRSGKKYPCEMCGKGFFTLKTLEKHQESHGPELSNCHMCSFVSTCPKTLRGHIKRHSMHGGTFKCLVCGRSYNTPEILKKHSTLHPKKLPFKCPLCPQVFNFKKYLTKHLSEHVTQTAD